jgi:hypothetical protein
VATRIFLLEKLHDSVDPADYERFVRERAYPFARGLPSVESYVVTRVDGRIDAPEPPYAFLEVLDVSELRAYKRDLDPQKPEVKAFDEEWLRYVREFVVLHGTVVE